MKQKKEKTVLSAKELAAAVGCGVRNIYQNRDRGNLTADEKGNFPLSVEVNAAWIEERAAGQATRGKKPRAGSLEEMDECDSIRNSIKRKKKADAKISELKASFLEKRLAPMEVIDSIHFRYLERFNSNMERLASVYIGEVGKEILECGEVQPCHIEKFLSHILNAIHDNKLAVAKEFENYNPRKTEI